jgi:hypothetical protein
VTRHILILSGNLPGLITAYRLIPYGFRMTILEHHSVFPPADSHQPDSESTLSSGKPVSSHILPGESTSLILHGFYHSTWSFLEELALKTTPQTFQRVDLEFGTSGGKTVTFPRAQWLSTLHPIIRLAFFSGLTWADRWHLINFLEKSWEGHVPPDHNPDTLTVESWLISARQSARALTEIWNPLCRFFLGCDSTQASLGYFLEVLSRFLLPNSTESETFLASPDMLDHLQQELKRVLIAKGALFYPPKSITHIQADTDGIQSISLAGGGDLTADIYVSTLPPPDLLNLLPERAPARFSCFSYLAQLQEVTGTAVRFTLNGTLLPPRLILNSGLFDWVTSQAVSDPHEPKTLVTCVNLNHSTSPAHTDEWLRDTAWTHIQHVFNISLEQSRSSCEPQVFQSAYRFFPCPTGFRTFRPLSSTPLSNLFLAGPWTATPLPPCLESTVVSAYACARVLAEFVQASSH